MKHRPIAIITLAADLVRTHRITGSWRAAARIHHVTTADGRINPGLAYRIAHGYNPQSADVLQRLGADRRPWKRLDDLTTEQVRWLLDHREQI